MPWNSLSSEAQLFENILYVLWRQIFVTRVTRSYYCILSWASWTQTLYSFKIHFNITLTSSSPRWSLLFQIYQLRFCTNLALIW